MVALNVLVVNTGVGALNLRFSVDRDAAGNQNINLSRNPADAKHVPGFQPIPEADRQDFFEKFGPAYSSVRYSSVLLLAAGSWLLWRRRQRWFVNHLIFSLHYYSLWYVLAMFFKAARSSVVRSRTFRSSFLDRKSTRLNSSHRH